MKTTIKGKKIAKRLKKTVPGIFYLDETRFDTAADELNYYAVPRCAMEKWNI